MKVQETNLPGVLVLQPTRHGDERGFFSEVWSSRTMADAGLNFDFVQDNLSLSAEVGTLRGLHFQAPPLAQAKLVQCLQGRLHDVVVDIRKGSPTYGQNFTIDLTFENGQQLLVPAGFLHGFVTREPNTIISYKVDNFYSRECDGAVLWSSCEVDWQVAGDPIISAKDAAAPTLEDFDSPFVWEAA